MLLRGGVRSVVVAVADALGLGEDGLRAGAGQQGGAVGAGRDAGAQVAAEQGCRESGLEPVADGWGCAGCYGFLRDRAVRWVAPAGCRGHPGVLRAAPGLCGARGGASRCRVLCGRAGRAGTYVVHGLPVGGFLEDVGRAVDLVPGQEQGGDGAGRQAFLLVGTKVFGHRVPDVQRRARGVFVAFEAELFQQVMELGRGAGGCRRGGWSSGP